MVVEEVVVAAVVRPDTFGEARTVEVVPLVPSDEAPVVMSCCRRSLSK